MKAEFSEQAVFEAFLRLRPDDPGGEVVYCDKPDVLVRREGRTYGYKITQMYHHDADGLPAGARHGQGDAIVEKARQILADKGVGPLHVGVSFANNRRFPKPTWPQLAEPTGA